MTRFLCDQIIYTVHLWEFPLRSDHIYSTFMGSSYSIINIYTKVIGRSYATRSYIQFMYGQFLCDKIIYTVQVWVVPMRLDHIYTIHVCEVPMRSDHIYSSCMGSSYAIRSYIQFMYVKFKCEQIIYTVHLWEVLIRS